MLIIGKNEKRDLKLILGSFLKINSLKISDSHLPL